MKIRKYGIVILCLLIVIPVVLANSCPTKEEYREMVRGATWDYFDDPSAEKLTELQKMLKIYATHDFTKCLKEGVKPIEKIKEKELEEIPYLDKEEVKQTIPLIIEADKTIAEKAIEDAENTPIEKPKHKKKVDKEIAKAKEYLQKAEEKVSAGKYDKAIDYYKKSWEHSQKAIKVAK